MCETIYVALIPNNDLHALFHSIIPYGIIFWVNYLIDRKILNCKTEQLELHQEAERRTRVEIYSNSLASYHLNLDTIFSILLFIVKNRNHCTANYDNYYTSITTRLSKNCSSSIPSAFLFRYQRMFIIQV